MKNILITGGTGFVGRYLLSSLENKAYTITLLGRSKHNIYPHIQCDLSKDELVLEYLKGINIIFHLAGHAHDTKSNTITNLLHKKVNYEATIKLAELAVQADVEQFIFLSSVKAGSPLGASDEYLKDNYNGLSEYGKAKVKAEKSILDIPNKSNMMVKIIRSPLVYGGGAKGNLALMKNSIQAGWFPPLPEFGNKRSMIHVKDLVRSMLFILDKDEANGEVFIVTDGEEYSTCEIYERISYYLNKNIPKYRIPRFLFYFLGFLSTNLKIKIEKIISNECYTSEKIESLGFKAKHSFRDIHEEIV
jgi:UDP-glucose 4-epimerase